MEATAKKILRVHDLGSALASHRAQGKTIVHCHGVFDLLQQIC